MAGTDRLENVNPRLYDVAGQRQLTGTGYLNQCCGTVTIFYGYGSGSDFLKVTVPVPFPFPT
jgi:hypothetical protein